MRITILFFVFILLTKVFFVDAVEFPKLSIIVSVQDSDDCIEDFLFSITRQTIFSECELILYAHNSDGFEHTMIDRYIKSFPQIMYLTTKMDISAYHLRRIARAEKFMFLDVQSCYRSDFLVSVLANEPRHCQDTMECDVIFENDKKPVFYTNNSM